MEADPKSLMDRRGILGLGAAIAALAPLQAACAQTPAASLPPSARPLKTPLESFPIWPGAAPGGEKVTVKESVILRTPGGDPNDTAFLNITTPILMVRRPARPNGSALLMAPGGGYVRIAQSRAGGSIDQWFADQGVTVFTLLYRLPADGWAAGPDVALQDAQRAIRLIRSRAADYQIDPARVGVIGFSAGGHVAGSLATRFAQQAYTPIDAVDTQPARPHVVGLFFPVITARPMYAHGASINQLIGSTPTDAQRDAASVELHVPADAPPTFLAHANDDRTVLPENSLLMYQALRTRKIATELHIYELGGHGLPSQNWQASFLAFIKRHGLYT